MSHVEPIEPVEADVHLLTSISPMDAEVAKAALHMTGATFSSGVECAQSFGWPMCQTDADALKERSERGDAVTFKPFYAYHAMSCPGMPISAAIEAREHERAKRIFNAIKHSQVARQLWWGDSDPTIPSLKTTALVLGNPSTEGDPINVIARLVAARMKLGEGGLVNIHGPQVLVPYLLYRGLIRRVGSKYMSDAGFTYVTDGAYPDDTAPAAGVTAGPQSNRDDDPDPGDETYFPDVAGLTWIYASGRVEYTWGQFIGKTTLGAPRDGDETMGEFTAWEPRQNEAVIQVEQQAALRFDPCNVYAGRAYVPATTDGQA